MEIFPLYPAVLVLASVVQGSYGCKRRGGGENLTALEAKSVSSFTTAARYKKAGGDMLMLETAGTSTELRHHER